MSVCVCVCVCKWGRGGQISLLKHSDIQPGLACVPTAKTASQPGHMHRETHFVCCVTLLSKNGMVGSQGAGAGCGGADSLAHMCPHGTDKPSHAGQVPRRMAHDIFLLLRWK